MPPVEACAIMRPSMRPQVDGGHGVKANIYVPRCGSAAERIVASKSAIVGRPKANTEFVHCYFEGNLYGAVNLERFADRLGAAADRMRDAYPTRSGERRLRIECVCPCRSRWSPYTTNKTTS